MPLILERIQETSRRWQLQTGVDDTDRILPIQYPPIQLPQTTG